MHKAAKIIGGIALVSAMALISYCCLLLQGLETNSCESIRTIDDRFFAEMFKTEMGITIPSDANGDPCKSPW